MNNTKIEWADKTWNPITGCSPISGGCANCYAARMAKRLAGRFGYFKDDPFHVTYHPDKLLAPTKIKKPQRIFVCSMGDIFHDDVPLPCIDAVFDVMQSCPQHTFLVLTKRPQNIEKKLYGEPGYLARGLGGGDYLRNVWLGVTAENQETANERIPVLLDTPAALRFVSVEPMLGPINMRGGNYGPDLLKGWDVAAHWDGNPRHDPEPEQYQTEKIDWIICGAETGPDARPMDYDWARDLRDQCKDTGVPFFFKKGNNGEAPPDDLLIREFPK